MTKKSNHYVNNKALLAAMIEYKNAVKKAEAEGKQKPRIPEYVGECILLIAERTARRANFAGYSYRQEMVSDGIENCILYIDNYDPEKGTNPFGYFGKIIWWAFVRRIEREKKQRYIKIKNMEMNYIDEAGDDGSYRMDPAFFDNEITSDFVREYEAKMDRRRNSKVDKQPAEDYSERDIEKDFE